MDVKYLHEQVDEYIKQVKKQESLEFTYAQALLLKAQLYLTEGNYTKALTLAKQKEVKEWLSYLKAEHIIEEMVKALSSANKNKLGEVRDKIQQLKLKAVNSDQFRLLYALITFVNHHLKSK